MATHSSVLAWRIPGTGEPGGLPSMGSHRVGHDWSDLAAAALAFIPVCCDLSLFTCYGAGEKLSPSGNTQLHNPAILLKTKSRPVTFLVIRWLRLWAPNAGHPRFNPWSGNYIPHGCRLKKVVRAWKLRIICYLVGIFRTSSLGDSISNDPERTAPKVQGAEPSYIKVCNKGQVAWA